jgi:hypothetical protein
MAMGQAAGAAAAISAKNNMDPHNISVPELQDSLRKLGAII